MESFPGTQVTLQLTRILDAGRKGRFLADAEAWNTSVPAVAAAAVYYFKSVFKVGNGEWRM